jgi:hypothetical protein
MSATQGYVEDLLERQRKARLEWANQQQYDPDEAARIFGVSAVTKLPSAVVADDLPNLEKKLAASEFDYDQYTDRINGAPAFNRFVAENPFHLSVLQRDWKELSGLERAYRQTSYNYRKGWAITEIAEIRDRQLANFEKPDNEKDKAKLKQLHQLLEGGYFGASGGMKFIAGGAEQAAIYQWLVGESLDEVAIGAGVGAARGAVLGGWAGVIPGLISGGGIGARVGFLEASYRLERGLAYDEYLGMGLDEEQARWVSLGVGAANAGLEYLGFRALTKHIPGVSNILYGMERGVINSILTKQTWKQAIARVTLKYGESVGTEIATEILQDATLHVGREYLKSQARAAGDTRPEIMEPGDFWSQVGTIAEHTLYGVAIIGGIGPGISFVIDARRISTAERRLAAFQAMGDNAEKSKTRKAAPTMYEAFVQKVVGKGDKIRVDARTFFEYFQEQGMDPEEVANSIGVTNLGEATTNGHDIEMPAGQYLAKVAPTPHHRGLERDLKRDSGDLSANEAQTIRTAMLKEVKELQAFQAKEDPEAARQDAKLHATIKERLIEGGTEPDTAEFMAMIMVGIPNLARRAGQDVMQFQEERFGGIIFTTNKQLRADKGDFDVDVDPLIDKLRAADIPSQRSIFGPDLIDIIKASGGLAPDSELAARDMAKQFRGLVREGGRSLDDIAEVLHEQGYIAQRDPALVLEALDRVVAGEEIFGDQFAIREDQRELLGALEQLERDLEVAKIDITDMTNKEVRDALNAIETYYQTDEPIDTTELDELTTLALESPTHDPQMLTRAQALLPRISPEQDFGDVLFAKDYTLAETDEPFVGMLTANKEFEMASNRKNTLKALRDCLSA